MKAWAEGRYDQLEGMAIDLAQRQVSVIATTSMPAALAAKAGPTVIPIVFETAPTALADRGEHACEAKSVHQRNEAMADLVRIRPPCTPGERDCGDDDHG